MNNLDINNSVEIENQLNSEQSSFLQSSLGQVINTAVDTGIKALLPDMIEDEVIKIKDTFINEGFSEAIKEVISTATNIGKSALGIITGKFDSISQAENALEKGGIIDGISNAIDFTLDKLKDIGIIPEGIINVIKAGKDTLLNTASKDIKNEFDNQVKNVNKLEKYNKSWRDSFDNKDIDGMEKYIKKIKNTLEKILPLENLISEAKQIENLHELVKNNGENFDLSQEQIELANILV